MYNYTDEAPRDVLGCIIMHAAGVCVANSSGGEIEPPAATTGQGEILCSNFAPIVALESNFK